MAVTGHVLAWRGASGDDDGKKRSYKAVYRVYTDNQLDGAQVVLDYFYTGSMPNPGDRTPYDYGNDSDPLALCNKISVPEHESGSALIWLVTVDFTTETNETAGGTDSNGDPTNNPLDFRPDFSTSFFMVQRPVWEAVYRGGFTGTVATIIADGDKIPPQASTYTVFDPPLEKEVALKRFSITINTSYFNDTASIGFLKKCNDKDMTLNPNLGYSFAWDLEIAKGTGLLNDYKSVIKRESVEIGGVKQVIDYISLTAEILIDREGWLKKVVDRDRVRGAKAGDADGRGGTISAADVVDGMAFVDAIRGPGGDIVNEPVLLNGDGQPLQVPCAPGDVIWTKWELYPLAPIDQAPVLLTTFTV